MKLFQNIIDNAAFLQNDFTGFSIDLLGIGNFFIHIFIAVIIISTFFLLGRKIKYLFFREITTFSVFVSIALGYIAIGTGMGLLGAFSLFTPQIISSYLIIIFFFSFFPFPYQKLKKINIKKYTGKLFSTEKVVAWGVILFIFIALLRLISPEITEDGYHTDIPQQFLSAHTTILESREGLHTIPFPKLPEMIYTICLFVGDREAVRFVHFGFYLLIISLLFSLVKQKKYIFAKFLPVLFVTSPVVIRYSSTQYTDFFAIFPFLLAVFLIGKNMSYKTATLAGFLFGAALCAKMWMVVYLPAILLYLIILNRHTSVKKIVHLVGFLLLGYLCVVCLWYIRAFIISGNPIFPILNSFFIKESSLIVNPVPSLSTSDYIDFNREMFTYQNLSVLSPFFFIGILSAFFLKSDVRKKVMTSSLFILFIIFTVEQLVIRVAWGRYLLLWFLISSVVFASAIGYLFKKSRLYQYGFVAFVFLFFGYYFLNTVFVLPYAFGWADKNAYLTRVLYRDNTSYYDFDRLFDRWISKRDLVATYQMGNFYYARFNYIDIGYIYKEKFGSFDSLSKNGVTKLLVKGGDITYFCKELQLKDCDTKKVKLLATYPKDEKKYNLYSLVLPSKK